MTRNNDWFLKCAFFLMLTALLITTACTAQMTAEQSEVEISPTPTSSPISLATVAIAPEKTAIIVETITPLPLKTDPAITNTLPITKTLPETVTDDLRPPRDVTPTVTPIPTPVPYPLVNPTVTHLDFISTTFHSPFTRLAEAHIFEDTIFFVGRVEPSAKNPFPNAITEVGSGQLYHKPAPKLHNLIWEEFSENIEKQGSWLELYPIATDLRKYDFQISTESLEFLDLMLGYISNDPVTEVNRNNKI